jgi:coenzyme PQQ precursor peptide PqqA
VPLSRALEKLSVLWCGIAIVGICENARMEEIMEWITPQFEEVSLNCEINSYANAEL